MLTLSHSDSQQLLRLARLSDSQLAVIAQDGPTLTSQLLYIATGLPLSSISLKATAEGSALAVVPSKDGVWGPTLVWLSAGTLKATLHGVTFSAVSSFSDGAKFSQILDVGLREKGIFVARREDGSAVVFGAETGTIKSLWNFHEAVSVVPLHRDSWMLTFWSAGCELAVLGLRRPQRRRACRAPDLLVEPWGKVPALLITHKVI